MDWAVTAHMPTEANAKAERGVSTTSKPNKSHQQDQSPLPLARLLVSPRIV